MLAMYSAACQQRGSLEAAKRRLWPTLSPATQMHAAACLGLVAVAVMLVHAAPILRVLKSLYFLGGVWGCVRCERAAIDAGLHAAGAARSAANLLLEHFGTHPLFRRSCCFKS